MKRKTMMALGLVGLLLLSCKKDRTCECTSTSSGTSTNSGGGSNTYTSDPQVVTTKYTKVKSSDIATACGDYQGSYSSSSTTGTNTTASTSKSETKCTIK